MLDQIKHIEESGKVIFTIPQGKQFTEALVLPLDAKSIEVVYENDAVCDLLHIVHGEQSLRQKIVVHLKGNGCAGNVYGLLASTGASNVNIDVTIHHEGKGTTCHVLWKGIALDQADVQVAGLLHVDPGAKMADTFLRADFILLSPDARVVAIPSLEIIENELAGGGHAATVGKLNPAELFYLKTRAIPEKEAKRLLVKGFLKQVVDALQSEGQREEYGTLVDTFI